ncbi:MAG: OmpA family protein [Flavobacteriales bacterium]|nr:OmpA family protein [Flavobacteriales bacterium]MCB9195746.1 OmpA family protein [Flavobacteriales bacterium]
MKLLNATYILLIALLSSCSAGYYFNKGDKAFNEMRYSVAIPHYENGLDKDRQVSYVEKLAHAYREVNDVEKAEFLYLEAAQSPDASPSVYFYLGKMHMGNSRMAEAIKAFTIYLEHEPDDVVARMLLAACWSVDDRYEDTTLYELNYINSGDELTNVFSPVQYKDGVVFTADKNVFLNSKTAGWTGYSYLDLYYMEKGDSGKWMSPQLLEGPINGKFHEGPATFTSDEQTVFFTRSNYSKRKMVLNENKENNLKIFKATLDGDKWKHLEELPFNSDDYSCGHPTLASDDKTLYFVSDMPGGYGGTDIYKSTLEDGVWSQPVNLGEAINTPGDEMFPYIHHDGTLYFSSDAHNTMGGLDVFMSYFHDGKWANPENLNYPLNTTWDDYGFSLLPDDTTGFVSSSRLEGGDRTYEFTKKPPTFNLIGISRKKGEETRVPGVTVSITRASDNKVFEMVSDANGEFKLKLQPEEEYYLVCTKEGCFTRTDNISTKGLKISQDFYADFEVEEIVIDKPIVLENIYYDFDKWNIREDAALELNKLVKLLNDNPTIHIEMGSHTDCRGTVNYNDVLSDKRAMAAVEYLAYRGIDKERLTWKGYGENVPIIECPSCYKCSEEEHQTNRRTEFKVKKM